MMSDNALQLAADRLGEEHGRSAGTWVIDGNTSNETRSAIIRGYDEGDPAVMDLQPSPLSGEWADDPTVKDVLDLIMDIAGVEEFSDPDEMVSSDLLNRYEESFGEGFWNEVIRSAQATIGEKL